MHTEWSWDTADSASMISACERAVAEGLPAVAFTEHLDFTVWHAEDRATTSGMRGRHPGQQLPIDVEGYFADIAECRERFPELTIWSGIEAGEPHLFAASIGQHLEDVAGLDHVHDLGEIAAHRAVGVRPQQPRDADQVSVELQRVQ